MNHRTITYRRHMARVHKARRVFIGLSCMYWPSLETDKRRRGQLVKGKVHCSCPRCACKSTKVWGKHTNSLTGYPASDKRKLDSMREQMG